MSSSLASVRSTLTGALLTGARRIGELGARLGLDFLDQQPENVVEQIDMRVVEIVGAVEEQRGDALQRLGALAARAVLDDVFEFGNQREGGTHPQPTTYFANTAVPVIAAIIQQF